MRFLITSLLCIPLFVSAQLKTPFELGNGNQSTSYHECIAFYQNLAYIYPQVSLLRYGSTDSGEPLHLVVIHSSEVPNIKDRDQFFINVRKNKKPIIMIMNGIHPGEPEGIDASMMWARDLVVQKSPLINEAVICIIPVYNIGGLLKRRPNTRANQLGPELQGFRGNAQNLDLNRDFVKADAKNTWAFWQMYHEWLPDVFLDNHTSNGADYQYTFTLISSQKDKQDQGVKEYLSILEPKLYSKMKEKGEEMAPYVNVWGTTPDNGYSAFFDSPRYSTGYTSLFGTVSFVAETHMLKPFKNRVEATYTFMQTLLEEVVATKEDLIKRGTFTVMDIMNKEQWPIAWELDKSKFKTFTFKGYEASYIKSEVTGLDRLYYDRNKPYSKEIKFYDTYKISKTTNKPFAYIIPAGWHKIADRIIANNGLVKKIVRDTVLEVEQYKILNYESSNKPYEGHFILNNIKAELVKNKALVRKGDYVVILPDRFALETLEPEATDAFMVWNFFDAILQQKEGFSAYVFEDIAAELLKNNQELRYEFELKKKNDPEFAKNSQAQLYFIYTKSEFYESEHMLYPIMRIQDVIRLPTQH